MKKVFVLISAAALVFAACEKEVSEETAVVPNQSQTEKVESVPQEIILKMDATVTKAALSDPEGDQITLNWKEGDVIGIKLSDESVISGTITIDGDIAKVTVDLGGKSISDVWFPYNGGTKPDAVAQYQSYDTINVPLEMSSIVGSTVTLSSIVDWCLVRIPVKNGPVGSVKTIKQIKLKSNVVGRPAYEINKNLTLSTSEVAMFDFVLPADAGAVLEVIVVEGAGSYNKEYRRKRSSSLDLVAGKTYSLPTIEVDDTGKHIWFFGDDAAIASSVDTPLFYWWETAGDWNNTSADTRTASHADHVTYTMVETSSPYRSNLTLIAAKRYGASYTSTSMDRNKSFPVYPGATASGSGQIPFLAVHSGNYPVFAIKMTNPTKIGTSRTFTTRLDCRTSIDGLPAEKWVDKIGNNDTSHKFLSSRSNASDKDVDVVYYDLSSSGVGSNGVIANTRVIPFCSWQIRILDVVADAAPTYDVYWAGFFNSVNDLAAFAEAH